MASYASLAGVDVVDLVLSIPRRGAWVADALLDTADAPSGAAQLVLGAQAFAGTIRTASADGRGRTRARLIGGAAGLNQQLPPKGYFQIALQVVLQDALGAVGEQLSSQTDAGVLSIGLPFWSRKAGAAADTVALLADFAGADWRVLEDGTVWLGTPSWPAVSGDYVVLSEEPEQQRLTINSYTLAPAPGTTLDGRRISYVEHRLDARGLRTTLLTE